MINRREFLKVSAISFLSLSLKSCSSFFTKNIIEVDSGITPGVTDKIELLKNYNYQMVVSYGDNLFGEDNFNVSNPLNSKVKIQDCFGYNNDYCAYLPIDQSSEHGILCINNEYPSPKLMFSREVLKEHTAKAAEIAINSLGHSIFEVKKINGKWQMIKNSKFNRRITPENTICEIRGYARGNKRLATKLHSANEALGTMANCSGGKTPWNTILTAEENFDDYFGGDFSKSTEKQNLKDLGFKKKSPYGVEKYFDRFNLAKNPNEANKFGYVVEIDPFNPSKAPIKHTSLGRFKHESATVYKDASGHIVVYSGDDDEFEHIYKFVSKDKFDASNLSNNSKLLDEGTLFVAKFFDNGSLEWLPMIYGENKLDEKNGFYSQADICIETRRAAKILGATKLDRPEGIAINALNQKIYIALTNNIRRLVKDQVSQDAPNIHGYILEIDPLKQHLSKSANWEIFYHASKFDDKSAISNPDNLTIDKKGNLWVATDGMERDMGRR